jgi:hypothetical protein
LSTDIQEGITPDHKININYDSRREMGGHGERAGVEDKRCEENVAGLEIIMV